MNQVELKNSDVFTTIKIKTPTNIQLDGVRGDDFLATSDCIYHSKTNILVTGDLHIKGFHGTVKFSSPIIGEYYKSCKKMSPRSNYAILTFNSPITSASIKEESVIYFRSDFDKIWELTSIKKRSENIVSVPMHEEKKMTIYINKIIPSSIKKHTFIINGDRTPNKVEYLDYYYFDGNGIL